MGDYNITKVVDGLFISDQNVTFDPPFLAGNKVIRILGWTAEHFYHNMHDEGIEEYNLTKNVLEVKFPQFQEIQQGFQFLEVIHQEMLCGLIYSQSQLQASLICIMYLMRRYRWNHSTAYEFLRTKMEMFECSEQTLDQLQKYEEELMHTYNIKLSHILWDYQFLVDYQGGSDDEIILITTLKNKMRGNKDQRQLKSKPKKTKRIKWQDQLRPSSPFSINSSKNLPKSSVIKSRLASPIAAQTFTNSTIQQQIASKDLQLLYQSVNFKNPKVSKQKKAEAENGWSENSEYQQLKEMSRTNFNDHRYMSNKVRRRTSLKPKQANPQKISSNSNLSVSSLVGIYGSKTSKGLSRASSAQSFLTGLRSFNKLSLNNA